AIEKVESNIKSMPASLGDLLENGENIHNIVSGLFDNHKTEILSSGPIKHKCRCSHDMLLGLMKTVNHEELMEMIETDKGASVTCTFCRKEYRFTEDELKTLIHPV
ncbi:MAG TPA: Hsp33 family molecular chaperone HslO, partial [Spirochaetota bacterium]|nr:Hsp33 family molecular chaperone HslO [Spirochaetota bacterium]